MEVGTWIVISLIFIFCLDLLVLLGGTFISEGRLRFVWVAVVNWVLASIFMGICRASDLSIVVVK